MLKEIIIFTGGLVVGALGTAYYAGYKTGKNEENSENDFVEQVEQEETFYEENSENFQTI